MQSQVFCLQVQVRVHLQLGSKLLNYYKYRLSITNKVNTRGQWCILICSVTSRSQVKKVSKCTSRTPGQYTAKAQVGYQFFIHVLYSWIKWTWIVLANKTSKYKSNSLVFKSKSSECKCKSESSSSNGLKSKFGLKCYKSAYKCMSWLLFAVFAQHCVQVHARPWKQSE